MVSEILMTGGNMRTGGPTVVQVRERGQFTIPAEVRREMGIQDGDLFSLLWVGETLIATRKRLVVPEIARAVEALMQREGVTLEDLLEGLEQEREACVREQYGLG
jgi:AbrB family looped-hinge helix DNA binding protein